METKICYLAGTIQCDHAATNYRAVAAKLLTEFRVLDPLRGKKGILSQDAYTPNEILMRDLNDIERADVVLAVMMKAKNSSFGTPCEIMFAWQHRTPVILITDEEYLANHYWVRALCSKVFLVSDRHNTFDSALVEATRYVNEWYGSTIENEVYD